ncbi:MAG: hypothetical protein AB1791_14565 [Chloroflexota bacterium]
MNDTTVTIRLGVEELVYLLTTLGIKTLPGLGQNPVEGLTEDQAQRALAAGANSLRARGWLELSTDGNESRARLDPVVVALLGTCATAAQLLFIGRRPAAGPTSPYYVYLGPHLIVIHSSLSPGVHEFAGSVSPAEVLATLADRLHLSDQPAPAATDIFIAQTDLEAAVAAALSQEVERAVVVLANSGVANDASLPLIQTFQSMQATTTITLLRQTDGRVSSSADESFSLLEGAAGFWLVRPVAGGEDTLLRVTPISAAAGQQQLAQFLP